MLFRGRSISLRNWLILLVGVGTVAAMLVAAAATWLFWREQKQQYGLSFLATSRAITGAVEREIDQAVALARGLGQSRCLVNGDLACFESQARGALADYGYWLVLTAGDSDRQIVNTQLAPGASLPPPDADPTWLEDGVRNGRPAVKSLLPSGVEPGVWVTLVQLPVVENNGLKYVVGIVIPSAAFQRIIDEQQLAPDWNAVVLDDDWTVVARLVDPERWIGGKAMARYLQYVPAPYSIYETRVLEGDLSLSARTRSSRYGWTTAVSMPQAEMFVQSAAPLAMVALGSFGVVALLVVAIAYFVSRLTRGIARIAKEMESLGGPGPVSIAPFGIAELDAVGDSMRRTDAQLRQHSHLLETRIDAVSRELVQEADARRQVEVALVQAQKMDALGQLTGGIAHDFNNMLAAVIAGVRLIRREAHDNSRIGSYLDLMSETIERSSSLVRRLMAFARKQPLEAQATDVGAAVGRMMELLRQVLGEPIEIRTQFGRELRPALVDTHQLESAVLNLCVNSRDAMPHGGRLTIDVSNFMIEESYRAKHPEAVPGLYVLISVTDTGMGMTPEVMARATEPFFTTKQSGTASGCGLGLAQVHGFVKQSGGHIEFESKPGHGTTAKLFLPAATAMPAVTAVAEAQLPPRGDEKILLVEDSKALRIFAAEMLTGLGYKVSTAADGPTALRLLRDEAGVDLLLSDVILPAGLNGRQLADQALIGQPDLKVLLMTGYAADALTPANEDPAVLPFPLLAKPFTEHELALRLREVLDRRVRPPIAADAVQ